MTNGLIIGVIPGLPLISVFSVLLLEYEITGTERTKKILNLPKRKVKMIPHLLKLLNAKPKINR